MTQNKEDYLNIIYKLGGEKNLVSNKDISQQLHIASASVTEMLTKLSKEGLITYTPYKGSQLTDYGLQSCIQVVRSHRLWEVFLMRHLGYSWSEAHEDAHLLEHIAPARLINRLDQFLNYPAYCPHGSVIPTADGNTADPTVVPLSQLHEGDYSHFRRVTEEPALLDYLESMGFSMNDAFTVTQIAPYEGPITLSLEDGRSISISYKAACKVFVNPA